MYLPEKQLHLSYCTNIHPSTGWENVFANIRQYTTELKKRISPSERFGIGLGMSNKEMLELRKPENLRIFRNFLEAEGLYVFTLNGFVYGDFHDPRIKDTIHAPDWRTEQRVQFSLGLIDVMAGLLPDDMEEGSFSTQPLSYKLWDDVDPTSDELWTTVTRNVVRVAAKMVRVRQETGKFIHMDIEPEPDCLIENSAEMVAFAEDWLLKAGADQLAEELSITVEEARQHLLDHVQVCYDTCHVGVAYERADDVMDEFDRVGLKVGKVQISSALKVPLEADLTERAKQAEWLEQFAESNFLHQVIQRNTDGSLTQFGDLPQALENATDENAVEWRIHYHVPIFVDSYYPGTWTTQDSILDAFDVARRRYVTNFWEVETYTWEVLPEDKRLPLVDSIERELQWAKSCL
jgi:hypothetical protein